MDKVDITMGGSETSLISASEIPVPLCAKNIYGTNLQFCIPLYKYKCSSLLSLCGNRQQCSICPMLALLVIFIKLGEISFCDNSIFWFIKMCPEYSASTLCILTGAVNKITSPGKY